jgi:hypothetical protein
MSVKRALRFCSVECKERYLQPEALIERYKRQLLEKELQTLRAIQEPKPDRSVA